MTFEVSRLSSAGLDKDTAGFPSGITGGEGFGERFLPNETRFLNPVGDCAGRSGLLEEVMCR